MFCVLFFGYMRKRKKKEKKGRRTKFLKRTRLKHRLVKHVINTEETH